MDDRDGVWLEAGAAAQAAADTELRLDAFEVYQAEAARSRLADRIGWATVALRCGTVLVGDLGGSSAHAPDGMLVLRRSDKAVLVVPVWAIVDISGSSAGLRDETARPLSFSALLRDCWTEQAQVRLLRDGHWVGGTIVFVGSDHVELHQVDGTVAIPFASVQAWDLGDRLAS
jgi:hypothetical protein